MTGGAVVSVPIVDDFVTEDGAVVLLSGETGRVIRLSAVGLAILHIARTRIDIDRLVVELEARFGPPRDGDVRVTVLAMVDQLEDEGLVTTSESEGPSD